MTRHTKGHATTSSLFLFISLNLYYSCVPSPPLNHFSLQPIALCSPSVLRKTLNPFSHFSLGAFGFSKNRAILRAEPSKRETEIKNRHTPITSAAKSTHTDYLSSEIDARRPPPLSPFISSPPII